MKLVFIEQASEDYLYWQKCDRKLLKRVNRIIEDTKRHPFEGLGKPEPLRHTLAGYWSRRIDGEHRFVYSVRENALLIAQLRFHYGKI